MSTIVPQRLLSGELVRLGQQHGTDKAPHGYLLVYEQYLDHLRREPVNMLEIGVAGGASLCMWREYFPSGRVCGIDKNPSCAQFGGVHIGDQTDTCFLANVVAQTGPLDIVVDDGSHRAEHQSSSLRYLFPHLKPGGYYFIEDVHWGWGEEDVDPRARPSPFANEVLRLSQAINLHGKTAGEWWGDKRRQIGARLSQLGWWERNVSSVAVHKSLVAIRRELQPL
jgi:hypothetical protein